MPFNYIINEATMGTLRIIIIFNSLDVNCKQANLSTGKSGCHSVQHSGTLDSWGQDLSHDWHHCDAFSALTLPTAILNRLFYNRLLQAQFSQLPPSLAQFSPTDPDVVVYTGYGMQKVVQFYSLSQKKVLWIKPNVIHHFYCDRFFSLIVPFSIHA